MPRPTDRARRLDLYFENGTEKEEFRAWAEAHGKPLSPFLLAKLREAKAQAEKPKQQNKSLKELEALQAELKALREDLAFKDMQLEILKGAEEREVEVGYTHIAVGDTEYSEKLILLLKEKGPLHNEALITFLGLSDDIPRLKSIQHQLQHMEEFGLIRKDKKGWRWVG
jgi:arsenate reductase-like glutaredoxin family protein